jgi:hypothetical protein
MIIMEILLSCQLRGRSNNHLHNRHVSRRPELHFLARNKKMIRQRGSTRLWRENLTGREKKHAVPSF